MYKLTIKDGIKFAIGQFLVKLLISVVVLVVMFGAVVVLAHFA